MVKSSETSIVWQRTECSDGAARIKHPSAHGNAPLRGPIWQTNMLMHPVMAYHCEIFFAISYGFFPGAQCESDTKEYLHESPRPVLSKHGICKQILALRKWSLRDMAENPSRFDSYAT